MLGSIIAMNTWWTDSHAPGMQGFFLLPEGYWLKIYACPD